MVDCQDTLEVVCQCLQGLQHEIRNSSLKARGIRVGSRVKLILECVLDKKGNKTQQADAIQNADCRS